MKTTAHRIQKTRADRIFLGCNAIFLALILAVPVGIFSAIYLVEYAKKGSRIVPEENSFSCRAALIFPLIEKCLAISA